MTALTAPQMPALRICAPSSARTALQDVQLVLTSSPWFLRIKNLNSKDLVAVAIVLGIVLYTTYTADCHEVLAPAS